MHSPFMYTSLPIIGAVTGLSSSGRSSFALNTVLSSIASSNIFFVRLYCSARLFWVSFSFMTKSSFFSFAGTDFCFLPFFRTSISVLPTSSTVSLRVTSSKFLGSVSSLILSKIAFSIMSSSLVTSLKPREIARFFIAVSAASASLARRCEPYALLSFLKRCILRYLSVMSCSSRTGMSI